jgi:Helitron helicase-like domain at N-terminus
MTCNPQWPEITSRLHQGQTAYDVPVIVARSFKLWLQQLQEIFRKKFGKLIFMVKVTEFQKRGFPHAHIIAKVCCSPVKFHKEKQEHLHHTMFSFNQKSP